VASVEKALEASDSGAIEWPSDELLPADLGVVVNSKRKSSSLVAVQSLVMLFVLMHNRLVSRLTSARDHSCQLQQEVERLQLELCQRITPAEVGVFCFPYIYTMSRKSSNQTHGILCQFLTLFQNSFSTGKRTKFATKLNQYDTTHHTVSVLPHYLTKVKSANFGKSGRKCK